MSQRVALPHFWPDDQDWHRRLANFLKSVVWTRTVRINTTPYTVGFEHTTLLVDATSASITINLPLVVDFHDGMLFVKKIDSTANQVVIHPRTGELIDDSESDRLLISPHAGIALVSDGLKWWMF
jgi:hypothetical protein